jgi:hypothetical protein
MMRSEGFQLLTSSSPHIIRDDCTGQGRAELHRCSGTHTQKHGRKYQQPRPELEHLPNICSTGARSVPGLVAEEVLRGALSASQHSPIANKQRRSDASCRTRLAFLSSTRTLACVFAIVCSSSRLHYPGIWRSSVSVETALWHGVGGSFGV